MLCGQPNWTCDLLLEVGPLVLDDPERSRHLWGCWWSSLEPPPLLAAQGNTLLEAAFIHGLPSGLSGKESTCHCRRCGFDPWVEENIWRRAWLPTPVLLPGESHGQRSLGAAVHGVAMSQTGLSDSTTISESFVYVALPASCTGRDQAGKWNFFSENLSLGRSKSETRSVAGSVHRWARRTSADLPHGWFG